MNNKIYNNFDIFYQELLQVLNKKKYKLNKRTNTKVKEEWGYSFKWDTSYLPISNIRKIYSKIVFAELAWTLSGKKSIIWINKYTKIWNKFKNENNEIETAYGYRWSKEFGINQIKNIIKKLKKDNSSRQQILMTWNPITDNVKKFPNIPCPYSAVIGIVNNKLNLYLTLRSNDVVCGLPYDLYFYTLLTQILANELKIKPGILFYTIANFHFYKNHQNIVNKILKYNIKNKKYKYRTKYLYNDIIKNKDKFVLEGITIDKKINKNWEFKEIADLIL